MTKARVGSELLNCMTPVELCRFCDVSESWMIELVEQAVLDPEGSSHAEGCNYGANIGRAKKARRMPRDLGLNGPCIAMGFDLLEERELSMCELMKVEAV